jgi:hypothetical protein
MIPSKSTLAGNDETVSEDSSNAHAAVSEHEQAPLTFKWYEETEDWDRLCPIDDDADMDDIKTRQRELYSSFW